MSTDPACSRSAKANVISEIERALWESSHAGGNWQLRVMEATSLEKFVYSRDKFIRDTCAKIREEDLVQIDDEAGFQQLAERRLSECSAAR